MYKPICTRQLGPTVFIIGYYDIVRNISLALSLYPQVNVLKRKKRKENHKIIQTRPQCRMSLNLNKNICQTRTHYKEIFNINLYRFI